MFILSKNLKRLSRLLGVQEADMQFKEDLNILEITNDNGDIVEYYLGDFRKSSENKIEFQGFRDNYEKFKNSNIEIQSLIIFESWEEGQDFRDNRVEEVKTGKEKRLTNEFFKYSKICYWSQDDKIVMSLEEDGVNYLEYKVLNKEVESGKGLVYNMSLKELYKLYNRTGIDLFKDNVRVGISNVQADQLRNNFKTKFLLGLYSLNSLYNKNHEFQELVENYLKDSNGSEDFEGHQNALENFWFHHNGITIYSADKFQIEEDKIIFDPLNVSVINGAQTLTHCTDIMREIRNDLRKELKKGGNEINEINSFIDELLDKLMSKIKIKTIFIAVESQLKRSITLGLNSQIPVNIEDIETNTELVDSINKKLKEKNKRICRKGEEGLYGGFYLLDFIKSYLMFKDRPGTARNLNKKDLEKYLNEIEKFLNGNSEEVDDFLKSMDLFDYIDKWWRKRQRPKEIFEEGYNGLSSNGKFYFKSYCKDIYNDAEDENDKDEYFQEIYERFIYNFVKLTPEEIDSNTLKKDDLYKIYLDTRKKLQDSRDKVCGFLEKSSELAQKYEEYKKNNQSKSNRSMFIKKELEEHEIKIDFRTINLIIKEGEPILREAFSLPSKTFSQFYEINKYPEIYDGGNDRELITFEDSYLKKEIEREFFLFIFIEDSVGKLKTIETIPKFSFSMLSENAKKVYKDTTNAFKSGNADGFVKQSDNQGLHIRPKAKDGNDTFTFTDGSQQIKRTFWVNRTTLQDVIAGYIKNNQWKEESQLVYS